MKKNIIISLGLFIITVSIWATSLLKLSKNNFVLEQINQSIDQKINERKYSKQIIDVLNKNNLSVDQLSYSLPDNSNFQDFVSLLESSASNNSTEIVIDFESNSNNKTVSKNISQNKTGKNYIDLTIELNVSSNEVDKSLKDIEGGIYFIEFSKLNYISRSDDSSLATIKAQRKVYVDKQFKQ